MVSELEKIAIVYGDVCVRRKRRKRQKLIIIDLMFDYFQNSTLHGLRYIAEKGLSIAERFFWFVTFVASISMCTFLIYSTYVKWMTSPVIVTVNGRLVSVGTVPFPAVTICPEIKVQQSVYNYGEAARKFQESKESLSENFTNKLENINTLCDYPGSYLDERAVYSKNLVKDITEVALSLQAIFFRCKWYNKKTKCSDLFHRVYTEEGVCYTTNNLAANEIFTDNIQKDYHYLESNDSAVGWSIKTGEYTDYSVDTPYPRRGRVYGSYPDLALYLVVDSSDQDIECNTLFSGYKIFLHHPMDLPTSSLYYYAALPGQTSSVAISFHQLNTDINLLTSKTSMYTSDIRQCYSQSERPLRYFKLYTASNCRAECLPNYTYHVCKCVDYYMPHHNSSEICSRTMTSCVDRARDYMADQERIAELGLKTKLKVKRGDLPQPCRCRPSCDNVEYDAEILKTQYNLAQHYKLAFKNYKMVDTLENISFARVQLFFKKPQFVTMQRRELFGITEFLADIGGLLGLFLGFSFLSLVEIFYFLTLRVGIKLKHDLVEEKRQKDKA